MKENKKAIEKEPKPQPTSIRIPDYLMDLVKDLAKKEKRSISKEIECILEIYFTKMS